MKFATALCTYRISDASNWLGVVEVRCTVNMRKSRILIGSNRSKIVERIHVALYDKADLFQISTWDEFEKQAETVHDALLITDLNLSDCFPSVVFDNMLEVYKKLPTILLLRDSPVQSLYRERSHFLWEVLPVDAVDDHRFAFAVNATIMRFEMWCDYI